MKETFITEKENIQEPDNSQKKVNSTIDEKIESVKMTSTILKWARLHWW